MELAKITSKGQITIPIEIRKKLGVRDGDKVLFVEEGNRERRALFGNFFEVTVLSSSTTYDDKTSLCCKRI